jgi:enolase-phosphatase E1
MAGAGTSVLLLDIEGTTTPVDFVYKTLFPFARRGVEGYLRSQRENPQVQAEIEALRQEHSADVRRAMDPPPWHDYSPAAVLQSAVAYIWWLMDRDRKSTPLKSLQGQIWQAGYASGQLRGEVYPDIPGAFERWHRQGKTIAIFSSGSVQAQRLLFGNSTAGDLTPFIKAYFDTTTGPKNESRSYLAIAAGLDILPPDTLFISDVTAELDAARAAGMQTALCIRPCSTAHDQPQGAGHPVIHHFENLTP